MIIRAHDENLMAMGFIDDYQSFLWRECYDEAGDVEIYVPATSKNLEFYRNSSFISIMDSKRLMTIEKLDIKRSISAGRWIIVQGSSAEKLLSNRVLLKDYTTDENVEAKSRIRELFSRIFDDNIAHPLNLLNDDDIPEAWRTNEEALNKRKFVRTLLNGETSDLICLGNTEALIDDEAQNNFIFTLSKGDNLYDIFKDYIQTKHVGMKLILDERDGLEALYLDFYKGIDHTTTDDEDPTKFISNIVFSNEWDNILDMSFNEDLENYKNLAYSDKSLTDAVLYSRNSSIPEGIKRREVRIDLSNEDIPQEESSKMVQIYGQRTEKIMNKSYNKKVTCDGEIDPNGFYKYHQHYDLGDVVEFRDEFGYKGTTRIKEYMFSSDSSGEKSYPGFAVDENVDN